jgi:hypothetical protein
LKRWDAAEKLQDIFLDHCLCLQSQLCQPVEERLICRLSAQVEAPEAPLRLENSRAASSDATRTPTNNRPC